MAISTTNNITYKISSFTADATKPSLSLVLDRGFLDGTKWVLIDFQVIEIDPSILPSIFGYVPDGVETLYGAVKKKLYEYLISTNTISGTIV